MLQVDRILCPLDASAASLPALDQALFLGARLDATIYVVPPPRCEPDASPLNSDGPVPTRPSRATSSAGPIRSALREVVSTAMSAMDAPPTVVIPDTDALFPEPSPTDLLHFADATDIDLLVVDTPDDRGPIPALASAPVRCLVQQATIPVFVVEHECTPDAFRRILVPTDFSEHARGALAHAKALAALYDASIDLLHVLERPQYVALNSTDLLSLSDATLTERKARRRVETFYESLNSVHVPARLHLAHGDAADQIGHFVDEHAIDLVVLSTHGVIGRPQRPLGSVVDKVLRRVAHPVFLTRAFGHSLLSTSRSQRTPPPESRDEASAASHTDAPPDARPQGGASLSGPPRSSRSASIL